MSQSLQRIAAALLAASLMLGVRTAACEISQAAGAFEEVPLERTPRQSHLLAYLSLAAGVSMVGASFEFADRANRDYAQYLTETDPDRVSQLYDRTVRYDRLSSGSAIAGEVLMAAGLYLRFLRRPVTSRLSLDFAPHRCAVSCRF